MKQHKLVKARPKAEEHLPEWSKCCEARIAATTGEGEITLDISDTSGDHGLRCSFCLSPCPYEPMGRDIADDTWVHLSEYDLDEGEAANA